ncbi:MAG TPA: Mut7-C RNAse domain-containing protein [Burkholderiaceae bacterium]|nr:Mut7-C RNAse domain-containing protein [Burkholderiaceae bacterium]
MPFFRFYAELNDFLAPHLRGRAFPHTTSTHATIKHAIEALGVPHTEVGLVLLNGAPAPLGHHPMKDDDHITVYPPFTLLRDQYADQAALRFAADAHLGRLARMLRFAGYDTMLHSEGDDAELVALASRESRVILTRDRDLLMHREVARGCYLRPTEPVEQLREVVRRLGLDISDQRATRISRCTLCNEPLRPVGHEEAASRIPPRTLACFDAFWRCPACERIYWKGSHWRRMREAIAMQPRASETKNW